MSMKPGQYMKCWTYIIRMCDEQDKAADLYVEYRKILDDYINQTIVKDLQNNVSDSRAFLEMYVKNWRTYTVFTFSMKKMFDYLDRYYLRNGNESCTSLTETS